MSNVELVCEKSFSDVDLEIISRFCEFQNALIDKDDVKLNELICDDYELVHMSGKRQSKKEFIAEVMDGTLNYFKSEIINPTILHDDENSASLVGDVKLTAKVYGINGQWTLDTVVNFKRINGEWYLGSWDN